MFIGLRVFVLRCVVCSFNVLFDCCCTWWVGQMGMMFVACCLWQLLVGVVGCLFCF